jgi:hypothetical protein
VDPLMLVRFQPDALINKISKEILNGDTNLIVGNINTSENAGMGLRNMDCRGMC